MLEPDLIELFVRPLHQGGFKYIVSGSVAAMLYGEPRLTHDIDFVIFFRPTEIAMLSQIFPSSEFYLPLPETITTELNRERGHFNVIHVESGLKADFYIVGNDELHHWAFLNSKRLTVNDTDVRLAPPEYVIVRKLEYYREGHSEKHLRDIRSMLAVSGDQINKDALDGWIQRRLLAKQWDLACHG